MSFKTDKQTLTDLAIFAAEGKQSVYEIFNHTQTRGGSRILEDIFQYPLSDKDEISRRSEAIRHYQKKGIGFPFRPAIFDTIEFYLGNTDSRSQLSIEDNTWERKVKKVIKADPEFEWIHNGILGCIELLNALNDLFQEQKETENSDIAESRDKLRDLLDCEQWKWFAQEKGKKKIAYEQAVHYDRILRFEERERLKKILHQIYLMDAYITAATVAQERHFAFAEARPTEENLLKMEGVFHPFLNHPKGNTLSVDEHSNVIFLTGANMAGKSTFMKSFGIALFLAHVGFPVPAQSMVFSVRKGMFTTINLPDNLTMGYSHFYAEVLRVKKVALQVKETPNLVVIFDELFRGTNVKDAYDATLAVTQAFAQIPNCLFMVSTHIIEVGEALKNNCNNIRYVYLPTLMEGSKPVYTYQLAEGITNDRHGMVIIKNEGIIDIIRGKGGAS